ncbi:Cyclin A1 1 [Euphorbia peplus]|nr:Cyclin A1 1 [Euphorbia peplus]
MSNSNARRASFSSSTTSSLAKRHASSSTSAASENVGKAMAGAGAAPALPARKRAPLGDISNHKNLPLKGFKSSISGGSSLVPCSNKIAKVKKGISNPACTSSNKGGFSSTNVPLLSNVKSSVIDVCKVLPRKDEFVPSVTIVHPMELSPSKSDDDMSLDETMSTCHSFKSPEVEYLDNNDDVPEIESINKKTLSNLYISDHTENVCCRETIHQDMETEDKIVNLDKNYEDPQLCATFACDIYKHLRASEMKKRPATDFMDTLQKDINCSMRAILVDWLVEVAEEYRLVPDTLYLTVNYIDRYLSGNVMNRQKLQLLGVACMMIASKYEEICAPQVEEFCYITDNTYFRDEVLEMESAVLNYLKFEMTAPTAKCFLRRFVRAAQGVNEVPSMQLECLANYISELSLLEYTMLAYAPSLIAASAIFLAKFILFPAKRPWNSTLHHYTLYQPSDLSECVTELHRLCSNGNNSTLPAIREKYSQHKYKFVAKKYCPTSIPLEYFHN